MCWKALIFLCMTTLFNSSCSIDKRTSLKITNMSTSDISNLSVLYRGGDHKYSFLRKEKSISLKITPAGESSITIGYEEGGEKYIKDLDVYVERSGHTYDIEVHIYTNGEIYREIIQRPHMY